MSFRRAKQPSKLIQRLDQNFRIATFGAGGSRSQFSRVSRAGFALRARLSLERYIHCVTLPEVCNARSTFSTKCQGRRLVGGGASGQMYLSIYLRNLPLGRRYLSI
jgi:hypothetical protein